VFDGDHIHALNAAFATRAEVTDANARAERAEAALRNYIRQRVANHPSVGITLR
jgi:hypothetical protein